MNRWPDLLRSAYQVARTPVSLLDDVVLDRATPCSAWTARQVLDHLVATMDMFANALGAPAPDAGSDAPPLARFDAAVTRNLAAWCSLQDPAATLSLSFAKLPADVAAGVNLMESLVHGWDLGAALGVALPVPSDVAQPALDAARLCVPRSRGHVFGDEVPTDSDEPFEQLLAFTGRDPRAWPGAIWVAGSLVTIKPTLGDSAAASAVDIWEREGSGPPRHVHAEHDEIWYVLSGRFTFAIGDREISASTGDVVVGPRGVPHTFRADSADARVLDIHAPGGFERFFVQAGTPAADLQPPPPSAESGPGQLRAHIESFGATVIGPPLSPATDASPAHSPAQSPVGSAS